MSKEHGRQLGTDMTTSFMLMTLFSIVADMAENPEGLRTEVKKTLLDLTDDFNLSGILDDTAREARDTAMLIINGILAGGKPLRQLWGQFSALCRRAPLLSRSLFNSPGSATLSSC